MKLKHLTIFLFLIVAFISQIYAGENKGKSKSPVASTSNKKSSGCSPGIAQTDLDINNVRATILTGSDMWHSLNANSGYEIPIGSGLHSLYAGALWIGGKDAAGNLKLAAQTYRQTGNDFWPGAIDKVSVDITPTRCSHYDKHWKINKADVLNFIAGGAATPDMISWPGNGDIAFNEDEFLAPFYDANSDGIYNTTDGDYPNYDFNIGSGIGSRINYVFGDQTLWWVFNDVGDFHSETGGDQIGLEIRAQAFAYQTSNDLNNCTFYKYEIINRGNTTLDSCYFGQWVDADLGKATDDFVGCHVTKGLGYCYNGDADDDGAGGYGLNPPAIGVDFLEGPFADANDGIDNDKDGTTDEPDEQIIMSNFVYYNNVNNSPTGNPAGAPHFYNYLKGIWGNGQQMTYGADAFLPTNPPCSYMFPGTTDPAFPTTDWTEVTAGNTPGDRRFLMSAGQFTLLPGAVNYITTLVIWTRATSGGPQASVNLLFDMDSAVQQKFDSSFYASMGINELQTIESNVVPNPFNALTTITFKNDAKEIFKLTIFDINGKVVRLIGNIVSDKVIITKGDLNKGVYLYKLESKSAKKTTGRLIVE
ncbi:MAG: T9SS type A sorting domain-containing protein [Bacteroidia bacterium]